MLKVTLAIASLLNQADARADEWTTTEKILPDSTRYIGSQSISSERSNKPQDFEWDYVDKSEYETDEMKYGAINWMKICKSGQQFKHEWQYVNMCDESNFSTVYCVGDCTVSYSTDWCNEISIGPGECINNLSFYAGSLYGIRGLGFETLGNETTDGTEDFVYYGVKNLDLSYLMSYTTEYTAMTNSPTTNANEQVCLTALESELYIAHTRQILNYKVSYNPKTPQYNSPQCEEYRERLEVSAAGIVGAILGICCVGGIALAVWFFCFRRTGSAGSLTADNQKPSTAEAAPQQTTSTTTVIQQQPAMMMQPQPMMVQPQPMMMQQQPMMMQQPGPPTPMMPQQTGMMPMQQPGMMPMQPMQQPGMMPMQPMQQPGMGQPYNPYAA